MTDPTFSADVLIGAIMMSVGAGAIIGSVMTRLGQGASVRRRRRANRPPQTIIFEAGSVVVEEHGDSLFQQGIRPTAELFDQDADR